MKKIIITIIIVILVVVAGSLILTDSDPEPVANNGSTDNSSEVEILSEVVGDVEVKNYEGKTVQLTSLVGDQHLILNSWAVWCPFCVEELKDFSKVQSEFKDEVQIVAVNRAESKNKTMGFLEELGVYNDLTFFLDSGDKFYQAIGGFSMPETLFVNKQGEIVHHKRGPMDQREIENKINKFFLSNNNENNN